MHNFNIIQCDTDGLIIYKCDETAFSKEEQESLLNEINSMLPPLIQLDNGGTYEKMLVVKSKNYILKNGDKVKIKGSGIRDQKKEPTLRHLMNDVIDSILNNDISYPLLTKIYSRYMYEANNVIDITQWSTKKSYSKAIINNERTQEAKVRAALKGESMKEGDKFYTYFLRGIDEYKVKDDALSLSKHWTPGMENKVRLMKRVYDTMNIFKEVIDMSHFPKYHLKTKIKDLNLLLESYKVVKGE